MTHLRSAHRTPVSCGTCCITYGIQCGIKSLIYKRFSVWPVSTANLPMCVCVQACAGAHPCAHPQAPVHTTRTARYRTRLTYQALTCTRTPHVTQHVPCSHARALSFPPLRDRKKEEMKKTIVCTPENAPEFRALARRWPELGQLIDALKAQDLFPGLRAARITLTGDEKQIAKGLAGVCAENAPEAQKTGPAGGAL